MHPSVRNLYKRIIIVGRDYPHEEGLAFVRRKAKEAFLKNALLTDERMIQRAVNQGLGEVQKMAAVILFRGGSDA